MGLPIFFEAFVDSFTPGWFGPMRRPGAPEFLFAQDDEDAETTDGAVDVRYLVW